MAKNRVKKQKQNQPKMFKTSMEKNLTEGH